MKVLVILLLLAILQPAGLQERLRLLVQKYVLKSQQQFAFGEVEGSEWSVTMRKMLFFRKSEWRR
ncbi:MAG: hypothetical protein COA36_03575 [Desulfotalea sp.]|nr:MAG: hypothetical protein COA36_03575 [Desulfotalea sp.]